MKILQQTKKWEEELPVDVHMCWKTSHFAEFLHGYVNN